MTLIDEPIKYSCVNNERVNFIGPREQTSVKLVAVKGLGSSHYILVTENSNDINSSELSYYEIIVPAKKESDFLSNFRIPM